MTDTETTFSVEVLGFPAGADPEALAASVSEFFGIPLEEGRRLVKKAPIRVKRHARADAVQQLVRQLRKLGADILVRNEQTGDERTYRIADARRPSQDFAPSQAPAARPTPRSPQQPAEDTLPSVDDPAPAEAAPSVEVLEPAGRPSPIGEAAARGEAAAGEEGGASNEEGAAPSDPAVSSGRVGSMPSDPGVGSMPSDPGVGSMPSDPGVGARPSAPTSRRSGPGISLPPPSSPILGLPPPTAAKLDFCGSCTRPVDKGETCTKCGWNNAEKERYCRQCKKKLSLVSGISRKPAVAALIAIGGIAAFAGGFVLFGVPFGAAALALTAALAFVVDGLTLRYACKTCTVAVYSERLQKEEVSRVRAARGKSAIVAIACGVITAGFLAVPGFAGHQISDASYGIAWTIQVPRTHTQIGSEVTSIKVPTGNKRMRVQFAERPYIGGATYILSHIQYTYPAGPADPDKPGLEASLKQAVAVAFAGTTRGDVEAVGDSLQVAFSGSFHGRPVFGRLRATQYEHDMVFVAVLSGAEADVTAAAVEPFLSSVAVTRDGT